MQALSDITEGRWYVDPHEAPPQRGDYVTVSDHNLAWQVTHVSKDGSQMYLTSVVGKRFGTESTARLKSIWRSPEAIAEIDWSQAYNDYDEDTYDEEEDVD